ncbi:hypothetical protein CKO31_15490 [Thiohalocapsa halophila]|uniref:Uncharacterized protein n=1 Tax=Thiohalocapsa halophila TaxID=69359 RepID=A0ABS1CJM0_9GAMM|nr:hypothetical protein [Thiohalocapsa halophila]
MLEAFRYWSTIGTSEADPRWISVSAGDRSDFASIPRLVWPLLPPVGRSGKAAVIWLPGQIRLAIAA